LLTGAFFICFFLILLPRNQKNEKRPTGGQGKGRETQGTRVGGRGRGSMKRVLEVTNLSHYGMTNYELDGYRNEKWVY
jgi:hypothetical protein